MKRIIVLILSLCILLPCAIAEDLTQLTDDDLFALRDSAIADLAAINAEIGARIRSAAVPDDALGRISDLFPDETLAKAVRDACAKFSIDQPVTQDDLDKVKNIWMPSGDDIHTLQGIGYCRNLERLGLYGCFDGYELPDEMRNCTKLEILNIGSNDNMTALPDWIGDLSELEDLQASFMPIKSIPDSIGNLQKLKELDLMYTDIAALPDTIGNCASLKKLNLYECKNLTSLPDSIFALQLTSLNMDGTQIR